MKLEEFNKIAEELGDGARVDYGREGKHYKGEVLISGLVNGCWGLTGSLQYDSPRTIGSLTEEYNKAIDYLRPHVPEEKFGLTKDTIIGTAKGNIFMDTEEETIETAEAPFMIKSGDSYRKVFQTLGYGEGRICFISYQKESTNPNDYKKAARYNHTAYELMEDDWELYKPEERTVEQILAELSDEDREIIKKEMT